MFYLLIVVLLINLVMYYIFLIFFQFLSYEVDKDFMLSDVVMSSCCVLFYFIFYVFRNGNYCLFVDGGFWVNNLVIMVVLYVQKYEGVSVDLIWFMLVGNGMLE